MESKEFNQLAKQRNFVLILIWFAMTNSALVLVFVVFFMKTNFNTDSSQVQLLQYVFPAISFTLAIASISLHKFLLSDKNISKTINEDINSINYTNVPNQKEVEKIKALSKKEQKKLNLFSLLFLPTIICLALNESISIFGFLLSVMKQDPKVILPFVATTIVLNILVFPRFNSLIERAERLNRSF